MPRTRPSPTATLRTDGKPFYADAPLAYFAANSADGDISGITRCHYRSGHEPNGFFDGPAALGWATWRVIGDACATATPLEGLWISIEAGALHDMPLEGLINLNGCGV